MLDDHRGLFILDDPTDVLDEFFGVIAEHGQLDRANPLKDGGYGTAGEGSPLGHLPNQVILDSRGADSSECFGRCLRVSESIHGILVSYGHHVL